MKNNGLAYIKGCDLTVDFPTYTADRSLKRSILKATTGGRLASDALARIAVRALDGLNFEIRPGDRIGLYGHNGSGKTTLLRVMTGAYAPTSGYLEVHGRVASLLDISMGMEGDATGWENILLRGLMMGMQPDEIRARMPEIGEFSGLGDYLNMPLRTYSSGMQVRLAFAVSTIVNADILMLDEWLSVGDEDFQKKAAVRLHELIEKSSIIVLASHSKDLLKSICTRVFMMERGKVIAVVSNSDFS
jgi:lipopolysaccharide transport system ATP-binding protein